MVERQQRLGFNHIDKLDFLAAYPQARVSTLKPDNILSGFAATGLVPYNPDRVIQQFDIHSKHQHPQETEQAISPSGYQRLRIILLN
jgi:hypothetical protein